MESRSGAVRRPAEVVPEPPKNRVPHLLREADRNLRLVRSRLRFLARIPDGDTVGVERGGPPERVGQRLVHLRDQVEELTERVRLRELDLMADEKGLHELLGRLLRMESDRAAPGSIL